MVAEVPDNHTTLSTLDPLGHGSSTVMWLRTFLEQRDYLSCWLIAMLIPFRQISDWNFMIAPLSAAPGGFPPETPMLGDGLHSTPRVS